MTLRIDLDMTLPCHLAKYFFIDGEGDYFQTIVDVCYECVYHGIQSRLSSIRLNFLFRIRKEKSMHTHTHTHTKNCFCQIMRLR